MSLILFHTAPPTSITQTPSSQPFSAMEAITVFLFLLVCGIVILRATYTHTNVYSQCHRNWKAFSPLFKGLESPALTQTSEISLKDTPRYTLPSLQPKGPSPTSMGLRRLESANWLIIDEKYLYEHSLRKTLFTTHHSQVVRCLEGSEQACYEVLDLAVEFLSTRYPQHFTTRDTPSGPAIHNHLTGESFEVGNKCRTPLETAARLAMEDFNILVKDPETGDHHLMASATLFPAGWKLNKRIGFSMAQLHAPVPAWKKNLGGSVNRYFDHLNPRTSMERYNLFIQSSPHLFMDAPEEPSTSTTPDCLYVRRERQTFRRLPKSHAVLFTVRTFMQPLTELNGDEACALREQVRGWQGESWVYKGGKVWGKAFKEWERRVDGLVGESG
ncbi:hypothetical protein GLAREA_00147 [Glarea lozoyensis ATCC 20868]|uniref:Uncharacterized protein n=1 Tax=Glarea lozoyensis (strain ATCC 20868 / MF5171) TaxID=1116229 RepID=S3CVK6_GLAL2|nr:uncharacterized protein GLAREA_00147 [Glarea lozoyensis ATCC 20868]EPE28989.1 hypothetical protein GLAREA_00147 [Glarea lozoyensis ATCC 20868]